MSKSNKSHRLRIPSIIRKFEFSDTAEGYVIEGKRWHFLTPTFNYRLEIEFSSAHIHHPGIVKRLLIGEMKLSRLPKKLYTVRFCRDRWGIKPIADKAFSWKEACDSVFIRMGGAGK